MVPDLREGDWVRHRSSPEPLRVVGLGSTIAVRFPNGSMQAVEPCELEKVDPAKLPMRKVQAREQRDERRHGCVEQYVLVTIVSLLYLSMLAWWLMAGGGR
jgi:hypothetical protein